MNLEKKTVSRRDIFASFKSLLAVRQTATTVTDSTKPYTEPLDKRKAYHLLRRTTFGVSYEIAQKIIGKTANEVVELLLDNALKPRKVSPPAWINDGFWSADPLPTEQKEAAYLRIFEKVRRENPELGQWWIAQMQNDTESIAEKMTLFWHGHFTSGYGELILPAQLMYRQNVLLREMHQGSFKTFLEKITLDGAMLVYLNGNQNDGNAPNENYARELLELYTMGIGNYIEWDVREVARLLTGWKNNIYLDYEKEWGIYKTFLIKGLHDFNPKYIFDEIVRSDFYDTEESIVKSEIQRLMELILFKRTEAVANFICKKIYSYFVYSDSTAYSQPVINEMVRVFISNKFQIRPVLASLLKSEHFFDDGNIGTQIKTPAEQVVGFTKHFQVDFRRQYNLMTQLGQQLFNPPNVAGWQGHRAWVTTKTLPLVITTLGVFLNEQTNERVAQWAKKITNYNDATAFTKEMIDLFFARSITDARLKKYQQILLGDAPDYEWLEIIKSDELAGKRIKILLTELIKAPDFHLC